MPKTIALDTSLLVLLIVGATDRRYISRHKRTRQYTAEDFDLLESMVVEAAGIVVTPNTLSETSNLLAQIADPARTEIRLTFRAFAQRSDEIYVPSSEASLRQEFLRLGLSDSALLEIGKKDIVVLSADVALCLAAQNAGYDARNFNHERSLDA